MNNTTTQTWTAKHNSTFLNVSAPTDSKAWRLIGAKNESDRNLLKSNGFQVVRIVENKNNNDSTTVE